MTDIQSTIKIKLPKMTPTEKYRYNQPYLDRWLAVPENREKLNAKALKKYHANQDAKNEGNKRRYYSTFERTCQLRMACRFFD
jgi:hypothetical protein